MASSLSTAAARSACVDKPLHRHEKEIVVAHYTENLDWCHRLLVQPIIYTKGPHQPRVPIRKDSRTLPNIGREAHTYLYHIIQHYENLPLLSIFTQGAPQEHQPAFVEMANQIMAGSIDYLDFSAIEILTCDGNGFPHIELDVAKFYDAHFLPPPPEAFYFVPNALFAVSRNRIHRYPKAFYQQLLHSFEHRLSPDKNWSSPNNPQEAHCMERLWRLMFGSQFYPPRLHP